MDAETVHFGRITPVRQPRLHDATNAVLGASIFTTILIFLCLWAIMWIGASDPTNAGQTEANARYIYIQNRALERLEVSIHSRADNHTCGEAVILPGARERVRTCDYYSTLQYYDVDGSRVYDQVALGHVYELALGQGSWVLNEVLVQ